MKKTLRFRVGPRTVKTALAVILSMAIVGAYGMTESRLIFAMLGAMAAVQTTFKESVRSSLTQIVGVLFGAVVGVLLQQLPLHQLVQTGIGIILVIVLYNMFHISFSPGIPCLIVVTLCITPEIAPVPYALGRIWDTAIGLGVGMLINVLIFPYDNSRQIRSTVKSLDTELIRFLEELFDGDTDVPKTDSMRTQVEAMRNQLQIFENQKLLTRRKRQNRDVETFHLCADKARELVARMEVLSCMERPGRLDEENRKRLKKSGADIRDTRPLDSMTERDVVTNYHVRQLLRLRRELLTALER